MVERRDIELLIRAKDLSTKPLRDVAKAIDGISDSLEEQVAGARKGETSFQELASSLKEVQEAGNALARQQGSISQFQRLSEDSGRLADRVRESGRALREFSFQLAGSTEITKRQEAEFRRLERTYQQAQAAQARNAETLAKSGAALQGAGVDMRNLAEAQRQIINSATAAGQASTVLSAAMAGYARNARQAAQAARASGSRGFLGLEPHAIQNLGFQINDLTTQIASGTSVTQAFAQQGGQILQVFGPGAFSAVARWIPMLAGLAATVGTAAAAFGRLYDTAASNRGFAANLALLGGGAGTGSGVTAPQLTQIARDVERLGFAFEDARKSSLAFLRDGLAPANISGATEAAARLSRVLGVDMAEATRLVSRGLLEGRNGLLAIQEAGIRFTAQQQQAIAAANASTDTYQRQATILAILAQRFREADELGLSPWQRAVTAARNAWTGFLDEIGRTTVFQALRGVIEGSSEAFRGLQLAGTVTARALIAAFAPVVNLIDGIRSLGRLVGILPGGDARRPAAVPGSGAPTGTAAVGGDSIAEQRAQTEATRRELELIRDDSRRTNRERIEAARRLARIEVEEANAGASAQTRAYLAQLRLLEFREKLAKENERSGNAADAQMRRDFQAIQSDVQSTIRARDEAVRSIQEDVAAGAIAPAEAIERIQAAADQARPALQRLAEEARRFRDRQSGGDAVRRAALDGLVATAERQAGSLGSRQGVNQVLQTSQGELQRLVQERQSLVQATGALEQQGLISRAEAERRIQEGYNATNDALREQIRLQQEALDAARAVGTILPGAYAAATAQLDVYRAGLERVDPAMTRLRQGIEDTFVQAGTTGFNALAEAAGNVVAGVNSIAEGFENAGRAALQFVADVLKGIAQVILKEQLLIAVQSIRAALSGGVGGGVKTPVGHAGGVVGGGMGLSRTRDVSPYWFANAPRMHGGGMVGLAPDERAAILQTGEEVLTRDDPRNMLNGGGRQTGSGSPVVNLRSVLAIGDQEIASAMSGAAGEKTVMQILQRNAPTIRQILR